MTKDKLVGQRVKHLRESRKISIETLSKSVGLDEQQISIIENGDTAPPIGILIKIARCLGVRLGTFIDDAEKTGPVIKRAGEIMEGNSFSNKNSMLHGHLDFYPLANQNPGRHMEPFIVEIQPVVNEPFVSSNHEGEEFIYVLNGAVEIQYGESIYLLNPGDSIYYDSIINHHVHASGKNVAKILAVIYVPV